MIIIQFNFSKEFFYQLRGDLKLKVIQNNEVNTVIINEGYCYVLEGEIPHKPVREENTIGIVIESAKRCGEKGKGTFKNDSFLNSGIKIRYCGSAQNAKIFYIK